MTATVVGLSGVSRSAFSRQSPGAGPIQPTSPLVLLSSNYAPQLIIRFPYTAPFERSASCLEVGMTGPVILGRAGRTPLP